MYLQVTYRGCGTSTLKEPVGTKGCQWRLCSWRIEAKDLVVRCRAVDCQKSYVNCLIAFSFHGRQCCCSRYPLQHQGTSCDDLATPPKTVRQHISASRYQPDFSWTACLKRHTHRASLEPQHAHTAKPPFSTGSQSSTAHLDRVCCTCPSTCLDYENCLLGTIPPLAKRFVTRIRFFRLSVSFLSFNRPYPTTHLLLRFHFTPDFFVIPFSSPQNNVMCNFEGAVCLKTSHNCTWLHDDDGTI